MSENSPKLVKALRDLLCKVLLPQRSRHAPIIQQYFPITSNSGSVKTGICSFTPPFLQNCLYLARSGEAVVKVGMRSPPKCGSSRDFPGSIKYSDVLGSKQSNTSIGQPSTISAFLLAISNIVIRTSPSWRITIFGGQWNHSSPEEGDQTKTDS